MSAPWSVARVDGVDYVVDSGSGNAIARSVEGARSGPIDFLVRHANAGYAAWLAAEQRGVAEMEYAMARAEWASSG